MTAAAPTGGMLRAIESIASRICRAMALVGLAVLLAFAVATLLDGLLRYLANRPLEFVRDSGGLIVAIAIACCMPLGLLERANINIQFIDAWIGQGLARVLDAIAAMAVWIVFLLFALEIYWYAGDLARANDITVMLNVPKAPFWYMVDVLLWLAVMAQSVVVVVDCFRCIDAAVVPRAETDAIPTDPI